MSVKSIIDKRKLTMKMSKSEEEIFRSIRRDEKSVIFELNVDCFHEIFDWLSQR